jgi:4-hydroxy-tetrahydrodipicolinate synthase
MLYGSIVALVTPFQNGAVDYAALEKLIKWHIESGTNGVLIAGSTGEGLLLDDSERTEMIKIANEIINKRIPLVMGCSSPSTIASVKLAKQAKDCGADAILSIVPFYVKPTQTGIIQHFVTLHTESNLPIIMYNNPSRCSVNASVETIVNLTSKTRIVGLKDSDTTLSRVIKIKTQVPNFKLFCGDDISLAGYLASGGDGTISVVANIAPQQLIEMLKFWKAEDLKRFMVLNTQLTYLGEALFVEPNPIPAKYALYLKGLINNELRQPLTKASDSTKNVIESVMCKWSFK